MLTSYGTIKVFIIPRVQDTLLPAGTASGTGPEPVLDGLEVVPEHPGIHGILGGLILIIHIKGGPVQDTWQLLGVIGGRVRDIQLLA